MLDVQLFGTIMRFNGFDLNLLVALDTLLETHSVARSAERLNLSQAAVSAALGRARSFLGDEILVLHGKRMHPTPLAASLLPQIRECLRQAETLIATSAKFDPQTTRRTFGIIASDSLATSVIAPMMRDFNKTAPNVRIQLQLLDAQREDKLDRGQIDLIISPIDYLSSEHPTELLYEEHHVVVGCAHNAAMHNVTQDVFLAARHVAVTTGGLDKLAFGDEQLAVLGLKREIDVVAPSFTAVPWLLKDTDRLAVMHSRLAQAVASSGLIRIAPLPFALPVMRQMMQFHRARTNDDGLIWLRRELAKTVAQQDEFAAQSAGS